ncbi:hypothetical protein ABPG77_004630 [Micractinium sp. CCAP 211/92]
MRLFIRSTGCPVPSAVQADSQQTIEELWGQLRQSGKLGDACDERLRLVHRGRVLRQRSAQLGEVCSDGDVLVLLPGRPAVLPCLPSGPPCKGPGLREINAAIREDLAAQGPGPLAAAEAAARRQETDAARLDAGAAAGATRLEDLLLSGEMGALRQYLEQLQEALRGPVEVGAGGPGGGDAAAGAGGAGNLAAALDAFFGLPLAGHLPAGGGAAAGLGGQAAAEDLADEDGEDEEEEGEFSEEEEEDEGNGYFLEGEGYSEEEEGEGGEGDGHEAGSGQPGAQLLPPRVPELDAEALGSLIEMGFPEPLCRNALLMGRNRFEPALEWLLSHAEDPAAAEPLSDTQLARLYGRGQPRQGPAVDEGSLAHLMDMGFAHTQAEQALRAFNNSLPAAASWLLSLGTVAAAADAPAAHPAAAPTADPSAPAASLGSAGDDVVGLASGAGSDSQRQDAAGPSAGQTSGTGSDGSRSNSLSEAEGAAHDADDSMPALQLDASGSVEEAEARGSDAGSAALPALAASNGGSSASGDDADEQETLTTQ